MKIHQLVHKILSTNEISTFIKGHNFVENERINIIQIYILSISMCIQNFMKIHQLVHKILSTNEISTFIKGHNSVENERINIIQIYINVYIKFYENPSIGPQDIEHKRYFNIYQGP